MDGRMISLPSGKKVKVAQLVKNPPAMQETLVRFLGWDDPLEEDVVTHSWILAWRVPLDRGAWRATVHGVTKSQTRLTNHRHTYQRGDWEMLFCSLLPPQSRENHRRQWDQRSTYPQTRDN